MNLNELEKLNELKEKGILTDKEFKKAKERILNGNETNHEKEEKYDFFKNPKRDATKNDLKIIFAIIVGTLIFFSIFVFVCTALPSSTNNEKDAIEETSNTSVNPLLVYNIETTIKDMAQIFYENEANAYSTFYGKRVKITGNISDISVDTSIIVNMGTTITLDEKGAKYGVKCNFKDGDATGIKNYKKGDNITIVGTVSEKLINNMYLKECIICAE